MSNCHVEELQNLWVAILADATHAFPTLRDEFERDLARLQRAVGHRGIRVFLEDLPAIGKHLDQCLSCGQYKLSGLPLTKRYSNTVVIPKFLRGLYLLVFHSSGTLKENCNVEALLFLRQLLLVFKKGKLRCSDEANSAEVVEFYVTDRGLPEPERFWGSYSDDSRLDPGGLQSNGIESLQGHTGYTPVCSCESSAPFTVSVVEETEQSVTSTEGVSREGSSSKESDRDPCKWYGGFSKSHRYLARATELFPDSRKQLSLLLAKLDFVSNLVTSSLGSYDPSDWKFRHGPGAVSEYRGPANKYYWTNWSTTLESEFPIADYGFHNFSSWADRIKTGPEISSQELPSRMVCVPKTYSKPRLIAAEPSANQWCQQNIWHYFFVRSHRCWISKFVRFNDQTLNQELCTKGSLDGSLATVDLSAASDRVTCHAVGQMFRSNPKLLNCLRASRSQSVSQEVTDKVPSVIPLRKFSTMGNACTFPVETLLFLSIALSAILTKRGLSCTKKNIEDLEGEVAVFGDDIVVPVDCRELVIEALEVLDFKVNVHKSFWNGNFRESCGVDAFRGVNLTPVYWRTFNDGGPESLASTVEVHNNFYKKFMLTAADRLASTVPRVIPRVNMRSGVFGLKSFLGADLSGFKHRENQDLQRTEVFVATLTGRQTKTAIENDSALLQFFTEDPDPYDNWESGIPQRPRTLIRSRWVALSDFA
jgi:hypothetical protein